MHIALRLLKRVTELLLLIATAAQFLMFQPPAAAQSSDSASDKIKTKFKSACASCHGHDGAGTALGKSMQAPDLRSPEVQKLSDADLAHVISEGKGDMPAFKKSFNPEQIQALVKHVRGLAGKTDSTQK